MTETLLRSRGPDPPLQGRGKLMSRQTLHAVDDVDLTIGRGEIVALVGESGSGKSTIARLLALVYQPTRGEIWFEGRPLSRLRGRGETSWPTAPRRADGVPGSVQLAQPGLPGLARDPARAEAAPRATSSGTRATGRAEPGARGGRARRPRATRVDRFPYELSGGQRQRIGFAQALALRPKLILADEPVSMLDVSIRIGLLNLMAELREHEGVSFLYITHDIASARYVADRVLVMYAGPSVEEGPTEAVLQRPKHPYTQLLLVGRARPSRRARPRRRTRRRRAAEGHRPEAGLPLPAALPARDREVRDRDAGATGARRTAAAWPATSPTDSFARSSSLRARS